MKTTRKKINDV